MELSKNHRLKILRVSMGLSQKDVANALEMTSGGYSLIETGKTRLTEFHLETLKNKLNFDINYILKENDEEIKPKVNNDFDLIRQENISLREQVKQLMEMVSTLTNSINNLTSKLGKLKASELDVRSKVVSINSLPKLKMASGQN